MTKEDRILKQAEQLAREAESWADFSNALYNPVSGLITTGYPLGPKRRAFMKTATYEKIQQLFDESVKKHGLVKGATPKKSGRFVVRLPQTLHFALEREAREEGVSLNQLVLAKLAVQLRRAVG